MSGCKYKCFCSAWSCIAFIHILQFSVFLVFFVQLCYLATIPAYNVLQDTSLVVSRTLWIHLITFSEVLCENIYALFNCSWNLNCSTFIAVHETCVSTDNVHIVSYKMLQGEINGYELLKTGLLKASKTKLNISRSLKWQQMRLG